MNKGEMLFVQNKGNIAENKIKKAVEALVRALQQTNIRVDISATLEITPRNELDPDPVFSRSIFKQT